MSFKKIPDLLSEHEFFKDFPKDSLDLIAGCGKNVHFKPDAYIAHEGDAADQFYVIKSGSAVIEIHSPNKGVLQIMSLKGHDIAGWSWIFPPYKWNFDLRATSELSMIALDGKCLRQKCEEDHSLGYYLMKKFAMIMTDRLKTARMQVLDIYG